jgi:hypothetical protein
MIWNESIECMDRESLRKIQSIRLKKTVERVYHDTPFYRKKMQELGVTPDDINSIDDIVKLPFTTKYDLRDNYPFGLCAVPMSQIVRIHASSGTTGKPTVVGYTRKDLSAWSECLSRAFTAYGAGSSDIFQVSYGYGLFTGGLGAHAGAENIGASVIPMSSGNTEKQITLMHDFGSTVLCCTPSYALYLADAIKDSGLPREEFKLKVGAFGAEPWTESMRRDIETKLGIKAFDIYGLSEIAGPGVGYECECQHGTHLNEDHYFPEIVDPKTLEPVAPGETGELVFTHLTKEGMPLLRYRTKDLTALHYDKCSCGRTLVRMDRILGRSDDMLIIRGVNVFPTQIESVILEMPEFEPHYLLLVDRKNNTDTMELQVEVRPEYYSDEINKMLALKKKLVTRLQSVLGLGVDVRLVEPRSIERSVGKAKRVIDNRKLYMVNRQIVNNPMVAKQLSIFLENKSGRLTEVTEVLAKEGVNLSALCIAENADFGILRGIVSEPDKAYKALKDNHFAVNVTDVVGISCPNIPGSLAKVLRFLSDEGVFIEYMYSFANGETANVIIRPNDMDNCIRVLTEKKVDLLAASELYKL